MLMAMLSLLGNWTSCMQKEVYLGLEAQTHCLNDNMYQFLQTNTVPSHSFGDSKIEKSKIAAPTLSCS